MDHQKKQIFIVKAIGGGGLGVISQILLILAYVGSPTYLVSKMGSLSSQLSTVAEIWRDKVGPYAHFFGVI